MGDAINTRDVDGGWAWVALTSSGLIVTLMASFVATIGIFQVEFLESFRGSQGLVALVCSFYISSQFLYGPVAGILSDLVTHRVAVMVGSAMVSVGMVSASFCQDLTSLLLLFGVVCGTGARLCHTPAITVVSTYFLKYRTLANGICLAAPGVGIVGGPYLAGWLIESFGWRYALVCFACVMAQMCVLGSTLFPHHPLPTPSCCGLNPRHTHRSELDVSGQPFPQNGCQGAEQGATLGVMMGSRSLPKVSELGSMMLSQGVTGEGVEGFRQRVRKLLFQKFLWVMCLSQILLDAGLTIYIVLFPAYVQSVGLKLQDIPPMYIMYGVSMTLSRVVAGLVFNLISRHWLKAFFCFRVGYAAMLIVLPLCGTSFSTITVCQVFTGMMIGPGISMLAPLLVRYLGLRNLSLAYGVTMLASGLGSLAGPPIAGFLYDVTGSYRVCIFVGGLTVGTAALSLLLLLFISNLQPFPEPGVDKDGNLSADQRETYIASSQNETLLLSNQKETLLPSSQKKTLLSSSQKESLLSSSQKETLLPSTQKESLQPSNQKETLLPSTQKETLLSFSQKETLLSSSQKETLLPFNQKETLIPSNEKGVLHPSNQKETLHPSNQKEALLPSNQKEALLPSNQKDVLLPSN